MTDLSIFSYLPNPRLWKASIVARLCGVDLEIRGTSPGQLADWLWDIEARPLEPGEKSELSAIARNGRVGLTTTLYKTEAFMAAHPFGNVPAGFAPDGTGIFESNSIMRAVARLGGGRCQRRDGACQRARRYRGIARRGRRPTGRRAGARRCRGPRGSRAAAIVAHSASSGPLGRTRPARRYQ